MLRLPSTPRKNWQDQAEEYGFNFHTMHGQPYWDETAYYQFTLEQIERDIEDPTEELHQMCLQVVEEVTASEALMQKFCIPEVFWQRVKDSWDSRDQGIYSRLDLVYDGKHPAKLLENNADTPTSLFETGFWQWLWLEDMVNQGSLSRAADQFNSLQEKLIDRFALFKSQGLQQMHFACCEGSDEDRGTVQYLQDCANEAGIQHNFVFIEDIGLNEQGNFTDLSDKAITTLFKLYPWEFMLREDFADAIPGATINWLEPMWKCIVSNKALLPMLWKMFPGHPNLLPAYFEDELNTASETRLVKKPIFSREGANISILENGKPIHQAEGPYGQEGFIYQAYQPLPIFAGNHSLIGSWLVDDKAAGMSVREDKDLITQDLSRYLPHIILG